MTISRSMLLVFLLIMLIMTSLLVFLLIMLIMTSLLVFLLIMLIMTSQFEWRRQLVDFDTTPSVTPKQQQISRREEAAKEKIILSQENNIQKLKELVRSLQQQLLQCKGSDKTRDTISHLTERVSELKRQQILED